MVAARRSTPAIPFLILAVGTATFSALQSLLNPVLPTIQNQLHTTQSGATWILTTWLLSAAVATPLLGKVGDMVGKKRAIVIVLAAVALGSIVAALAPNLSVVLVGRVLQGLGGAITPLAFGMLRDIHPPQRVPGAIGLLSSVIAVGGGLGTVLAGPIESALGWRWLFWLPLLIVVLTALAAAAFLPESTSRPGGRINWTAASLLAGWLVALLLPLSEGSAWGWSNPLTQGLFVASAVLIVLWIWVEFRSDNPVIDMRMMRRPAVWTTNLVALLFGATMFAVLAFVPQLVQTPRSTGYGLGLSVTGSGLVVVPMLVTMAIAGPLSGRLANVVSFRMQVAAASLLSAIATAGIAFQHSSAVLIGTWGAVYGLGLGLAYAAIASLVVQSVPAHQTGVASGMNANIRTIGGAIGTAVVAAVVTAQLGRSGFPLEHGYLVGFVILAVFAIIATAVAFLVPRDHAHHEEAAAPPVVESEFV